MSAQQSSLPVTAAFAAALASLAVTSAANAEQLNPQFKVYGTGQPKQNEIELVYWFDYVAQSDYEERAQRHTLEVEYGLTDTWALGFYSDFKKRKDEDLQYAQTRAVVSRFKLFDKGERFFDASIYFEYYAPRESYIGEVKDAIEARIILEKDMENWDLRLNPKFEKVLGGPDVGEGVEFEYAAALYRKINSGFSVGLEGYGNMGEVAHMIPSDHPHYLVPAVEVRLADELWLNVGAAFGITDSADDVTLKTFIEFEF